MSTIDQEAILSNVRKLADSATRFADKANELDSGLKSAIEQETQTINNFIRLLFKALEEENEKSFSKLQEEIKSSISSLEKNMLEISTKFSVLRDELDGIKEKTSGLNTRLDSFSANVDFLKQHVGSLATKQHVDDSVSRYVAEQNLLLTERLASKDVLEKIDKRLDGEDGQGGLLSQVNELSRSVNEEVGHIKTELAGKTTSKEFWFGICLTIVLAILGSIISAVASMSWVVDKAFSPFQDLDERVQELEAQDSLPDDTSESTEPNGG